MKLTIKKTAVYALFTAWLIITTVALLSPATTVRSAQSTVRPTPAMRSHAPRLSKSIIRSMDCHFFWFVVLAALAALLPAKITLRAALILLYALSAYGLTAEVIQELFLLGRSFQWADMRQNEAGIVVGLAAVLGARSGVQHLFR